MESFTFMAVSFKKVILHLQAHSRLIFTSYYLYLYLHLIFLKISCPSKSY